MECYIGEIRAFAGNYAPEDWALCNGATIPISGNEALYSLLGITYGGDGVTNFKLPDLRVKLPVGAGTISAQGGTGNYVLAATGGTTAVTLTPADLPPHTHAFTGINTPATSSSPLHNMLAASNGNNSVVTPPYPDVNLYTTLPLPSGGTTTPNATLGASTIGNTGGVEAHQNMMPYLCVNFIIALTGLYPQQA
ncbi:phage tail protein [Chitinophaga sancti]|uniref:Microcystin-dependent protein n=1 Tax=Chitinophaga sancti TaxID=1004 RepID=A0A1K1SND6_9BACT|nr:tail fiber protein [Chitinophaga sancti]WQD63918.1 tail fiber protein [Chitinophaga sancti]WQG90457.1 tail fiber protein [Chitinophaga sancti]SFW85405.1 Microcystin-dependent protein [Chitinophaga sancti]